MSIINKIHFATPIHRSIMIISQNQATFSELSFIWEVNNEITKLENKISEFSY